MIMKVCSSIPSLGRNVFNSYFMQDPSKLSRLAATLPKHINCKTNTVCGRILILKDHKLFDVHHANTCNERKVVEDTALSQSLLILHSSSSRSKIMSVSTRAVASNCDSQLSAGGSWRSFWMRASLREHLVNAK
jgi:hypothetical protein